MDRLRFLGGSAASLVMPSPRVASAQPAAPLTLVPFRLYAQHWDDHYFAWLPAHPRFEAIELMTTERGPSMRPLRWAFFTERGGAKTQVHYYDDPDVARNAGAAYTPITLQLGPPNGAGIAGANIGFRDNAGAAIRWSLGFAADAGFAPAGLTDQSGHAADRIALYFYREQTALAREGSVTIGTAAFAPSLSYDGTQPAAASAYSRNIFTAVVPYGDYRGTTEGATVVLSDGTRLAPRPDGESFAGGDLVLERRNGGLLQYRVASRGRPTSITFAAPLGEGRTPYVLAFDSAPGVLRGTAVVSIEEAVTSIAMQPEFPAWSRAYGFTTQVTRDGSGFRATTRRTPS